MKNGQVKLEMDFLLHHKFLHPNSEYLAPRFTLEPIHVIEELPDRIDFSELTREGIYCYLWLSARTALRAIRDYKTNGVDSRVSITTTSQTDYISSCISTTFPEGLDRAQNESNKWDIFAADFGYLNPELSANAQIYDDAWSFSFKVAFEFLVDSEKYYVTSLPKVLGSAYGAIVLTRDPCFFNDSNLNSDEIEKISLLASKLFFESSKIGERRVANLNLLEMALGSNFRRFFHNFETDFPGAGVFESKAKFNEIKFKSLLNSYGIRGTSFFGNNSIILPIHQRLSINEINYISEISLHCLKGSG